MRHVNLLLTLSVLSACASPNALLAAEQKAMEPTNAQMTEVLDELQKLHGKPIETCTPEEARKQPTLTDAVKKVLAKEKKPSHIEVGSVTDTSIPSAGGTIPVTVFTPSGTGPFPVIVYYHGGGFVIADNKVYESSARALCNGTNAVVLEVEYRRGPEHMFPTAHDDALAAYKWALSAKDINSDSSRIALVGESAGGNLALSTAIAARDEKLAMPTCEVLVYPLVDNDTTKQSYKDNADAIPLNARMMPWFGKNYLRSDADGKNPRYDLPKADLRNLAPVTIINAQVDPLRDDGKVLEDALKTAGVQVNRKIYLGVTHEFFGAGAVIDEAKKAMNDACADLKTSFKK